MNRRHVTSGCTPYATAANLACLVNELPTSMTGSPNDLESAATKRQLARIVQGALPGAQILRVVPLGPDAQIRDESAKRGGYGAPLRLEVDCLGKPRSLVLHTVTSNRFGHDRRADRAQEVLLAADTFGDIPQHVAVLDVGAYRGADDVVSLADSGEFYLLTTHAEGEVYANDLRSIARMGDLTVRDMQRHAQLVDYLARVHERRPARRSAYERFIRDTLGSGEGIFGIVDSYPEGTPEAPLRRLERIEKKCLALRHNLKRHSERLRRTHGDFHPFNVLFDEQSRLAVLDTSRGSLGDPADDVTCMAINYPFFSLGHAGAWRGAFRVLWHEFWRKYLTRLPDDGLYHVVPLVLAWRGLVLASPVWYPELAARDRDRLLSFVERALEVRFTPNLAEEFFDS